MPDHVEILLVDADVIIDYREAEALRALSLVSKHVGPVRALTLVHDQVEGLSRRTCTSLGLAIEEPEFTELEVAAAWTSRVGLVDATCLAVARERTWTLVSNDGALGRLCEQEGVMRRRGLWLLVELVRQRAATRREVRAIARRMQKANPVRLGASVMTAFEEQVLKYAGA